MLVLQELKGGRQFFKTLGSLNLGAMCIGITLGWPGPAFFQLSTSRSTYKDIIDGTLLKLVMDIGCSIGVLIPMCFVDVLGRKRVFGISGAVDAVSWMFLAIGGNEDIFIGAAFAAGLATGIFMTTVALYVAEISFPTSRGIVSSLTTFCVYTGILVTDCVMTFSCISVLMYAMCVMPVIFSLTASYWMIESPYYLYQRGRVLEAKISLKALRGMRTVLEIDDEFKSMVRFFNMKQDTSPTNAFRQMLRPETMKKSIAITLPILCMSQMIGGYAIDNYAEQIINFVIPCFGRITLSFVNVLSVGVCLYMIEKVGRKPLLMISVIGSAFCCSALGIYHFLVQDKCQILMDKLAVPITIISIYYAVYSLGLTPILPIITGEIFPSRVKTIAVSSCMIFIYLTSIGMREIYSKLHTKSGPCLAFTIFTLGGSIGIPLIIFSLPETKGKSLYEIQGELEHPVVIFP